MRDSVPSARYSSVCNVLRQWRIWLIPTYKSYTVKEEILDGIIFGVFKNLGLLVGI